MPDRPTRTSPRLARLLLPPPFAPPPAVAPTTWLTRICRGMGGYLRRQGAALPPLASLDLQSPLRFRAMHEEIVTSGEGGRGPSRPGGPSGLAARTGGGGKLQAMKGIGSVPLDARDA